MANEYVDAHAETDDNDVPKVCITIKETRGFGFSERDYVYLTFEQARELQDELEEAVNTVEKQLNALEKEKA